METRKANLLVTKSIIILLTCLVHEQRYAKLFQQGNYKNRSKNSSIKIPGVSLCHLIETRTSFNH